MSSISHWQITLILLLVASLALVVRSAPAAARVPRGAKDDKGGSDKTGSKESSPKDDDVVEYRLFEGDIVLTDEQSATLPGSQTTESATESATESGAVRNKRSLISVTPSPGKAIHHTWSGGVVPFEYGTLLDARYRKMFDMAINIIENKTCIRFKDREGEANFLVLDRDHANECKSHVGCLGGAQRVTLGDGCASVGTALHELCHALGLWHEHSRVDRDLYIEIFTENLKLPQYEAHFKKVSQQLFKSVPDVGYDIQSVMHYNPFAFARERNGNDRRTIRVRQDADLEELNCTNRLPMGQREQLSYKDQMRLNQLYQCTDIVIKEPECVMPTPTPTTTDEPKAETTVVPEPTTITQSAPSPTPARNIRLRSRNIISLTLIEKSAGGTVEEAHGIECVPSPGCTPIPCVGSACESPDSQFQIVKIDEEENGDSIRSGNTVVLRSIESYSQFLNCSNPAQCVLSDCRKDNVEDPNNASYIPTCTDHLFEIVGVKRKLGKILNVKHDLKFKSKHPHPDPKQRNSEHYLSCNGKFCHLLKKGDCPASRRPVFTPVSSQGECPIDTFKAKKVSW